MTRYAVIFLASFLLTGCFDLEQKIALNRDGSGSYEVAVTAEGMIGEAMKKERIINDAKQPVQSETEVKNGFVVHREHMSFTQLSDLSLSDEDVALTVHGRDFFGFGPTHASFRRIVHSADAEKARASSKDKDSEEALSLLFGNHTYTFSVTLPGSIERIAPVKVAGVTVQPEVTGDFYHGHTITWRMPLHMMFAENNVTFAVDFAAVGSFEDSRSQAKRSMPPPADGNSD
jgi:hypothetical protein